MTDSTALNASRRASRAGGAGRRRAARRRRDRRRHHRHRHRARRRDPRADGRAGGEARPGVRHQPVELQAGARRAALPGDRQRRDRAAQRHRTRNPDDAQRSSPRQGHAAAGSAAALDEQRRRGRWCVSVSWQATGCASSRARRRRRCRGHGGSPRAAPSTWRPPCGATVSRGGLLAYDGQLIDDARLVTAVARTAAQHGARILTRVAASNATGTSVRLTDQLHRRVVRRVGPRRHQRQRRVGGGGRHLDQAAAQPRNASGVRRRVVRQSRLRR